MSIDFNKDDNICVWSINKIPRAEMTCCTYKRLIPSFDRDFLAVMANDVASRQNCIGIHMSLPATPTGADL